MEQLAPPTTTAEARPRAVTGRPSRHDRHRVALLWGSAHLPGMARRLQRSGYRLRAEHWFTVCTL